MPPTMLIPLETARAMHKQGRLEEAEAAYRSIRVLQPDNTKVLTLLGSLLLQKGERKEGIALLDKSLELQPDQPEVYNNKGIALQEMKCFTEALECFEHAITGQPRYAAACNNRGLVLKYLGKHEAAIMSFEDAVRFDPVYAEACYNLANTLLALKRFSKALDAFDKALLIRPAYLEAQRGRAAALSELKRYPEALQAYDNLLAHRINDAEFLRQRGDLQLKLKQYQAALQSYHDALAMEPENPSIHHGCGIALNKTRQHEKSVQAYNRAISLKPDEASMYYNRGVSHKNLGQYQKALLDFETAILLRPNYPDAHFAIGDIKLLSGKFSEGWPLYQWRFLKENKKQKSQSNGTLWLGQFPIEGKTMLIHAEQGFGDIIQFCRYAMLCEQAGAKVILQTYRPLIPLLETLSETINIIPTSEDAPSCDVHAPVMSLPLAFSTTLDTIPAYPAYLSALPEKLRQWEEKITPSDRPKIGIAWSGKESYGNDHRRSMELALFEKLLLIDVDFHVMQKDIREHDTPILKKHPNLQFHGEELADFSDTAALAEHMELIITVDTSIAHLAGALGKPFWILLPFDPDFRWMIEREDSPWYPTARLFRQKVPDDWQGVIDSVAVSLHAFLSTSRRL